jgi:hypothetical protein
MILPSGRTATPAGLRRNTRLASIGTGGWFASEWVAGFVGIRIHHVAQPVDQQWEVDVTLPISQMQNALTHARRHPCQTPLEKMGCGGLTDGAL